VNATSHYLTTQIPKIRRKKSPNDQFNANLTAIVISR